MLRCRPEFLRHVDIASFNAGKKPVSLVLYSEPLNGPRRSLRTSEVRRVLSSIWRRSYPIARPLHHPEFRAMLRFLHGTSVGSRARI